MLRVQIAVAKKSNCQSRPSSMDIYKRKVDSYENQLKEMADELAALKQEESNFYLDIATGFGKGVAERDAKPNALVTERECSINMSNVSNSLSYRAVASQMARPNCKTPSTASGLSGLFQQAERLFSDGSTPDHSAGAASSVNVTPVALRTEATSSIFSFQKSTPTLMDAAAKENTTNHTAGFQLDDDNQRQKALGRTSSPAVGVSSARIPGSKGGKPSFKFVSKTSATGNKGKSKVKSSGFPPVVVMETEEKRGGGAEQMSTSGRKRSVFDREFGGLEQ